MSNFNKEELRYLDHSLQELKFSCINPTFEKKIDDLKNKIESLIDNYCEHKDIGAYSDADYVYFCRDCSVVTGAI